LILAHPSSNALSSAERVDKDVIDAGIKAADILQKLTEVTK
jgi:hypothetical protein